MRAVDWFAHCGSDTNDISIPFERAATIKEAAESMLDENCWYAKLEAQNDLTVILASKYPNEDCYWNSLIRDAKKEINQTIMPAVTAALTRIDANAVSDAVLVDFARIATHAAYAKKLGRLPDFFAKLFSVYQAGHLPCGWSENVNNWPRGRLIVY